ncbi:hypothetical protein NFI96_006381 [Prochilodus magdalenae]|nr:hypothetical protein NFI96_006381 [Prochilodus magdalenae]
MSVAPSDELSWYNSSKMAPSNETATSMCHSWDKVLWQCGLSTCLAEGGFMNDDMSQFSATTDVGVCFTA